MNGKILVVDDDPTHLFLAQELLENDGHTVLTNVGGFGVTNKVIKERPDVVLLDVNMPGLSGETVAGLLERVSSERPMAVLIHSSNDEEVLRATSARLGTDGFVAKGDPAALRAAVRAALYRVALRGR
jgi:CheY-like chemotaxis protein